VETGTWFIRIFVRGITLNNFSKSSLPENNWGQEEALTHSF